MAKRKKKSGGGGFGNRKSHSNGGGMEPPEIINRTRRGEPTLRAIERILELKDFASEDEMQHFFETELVHKSPEELFDMIEEFAPLSDAEQAERMLEALPDDCSLEELLDASHQALAIAPDCITAWLMLAINEPDEEKAMEYTNDGIEHGTARHKDLIDAIDGELGLWGHVAARDLVRLVYNKGKLHEEQQGEFAQAEAAYRQCLAWNPRDNIGVRGNLLRILVVQRRLDQAQALLDDFAGDQSTAMVWGRALLAIVRAMDEVGYEPPDGDVASQYATPDDYLDTLGPEFDEAKRLVHAAAMTNPFVPLLFSEDGLFDVEIPGMLVANGPYDAAEYLQKWAVVWHISGLPTVMLSNSEPKNLKSRITGQGIREEIIEITEQLEAYTGPPWWKILHDQVEAESS